MYTQESWFCTQKWCPQKFRIVKVDIFSNAKSTTCQLWFSLADSLQDMMCQTKIGHGIYCMSLLLGPTEYSCSEITSKALVPTASFSRSAWMSFSLRRSVILHGLNLIDLAIITR